MYFESKGRSAAKTISWRTLATLTTAIIVYILTGELVLAIAVGSIEVIAKIILYFFHERAWNKIKFGKRMIQPCVIWFTGLPGSGKSTLAEKTYQYIIERGLHVEQLDGDKVRSIFPNTGFLKEDRNEHIKRIGYLASLLEKNNVIVVASFISPYAESRHFVRQQCMNFLEIFVDTPLEICEQRDPKGLYKKARSNDINDFTGIDAPYEKPKNPELRVQTNEQSVEESFNKIKILIDHHLNQHHAQT